jgi:hypothetical protein
MLVFLKVLLHLAYFAFVGVAEFFVFNWLLPNAGMGVALVVSGILLLIFVLLYFVIFWGWRPSGEGFFDAIFDIGDIFD